MRYTSFSHYLALREGLLGLDRAPAAGLPRFNAWGMTNDQRKKLKVDRVPGGAGRPVVRPVVPPQLIPRNLSPSDVGTGGSRQWAG